MTFSYVAQTSVCGFPFGPGLACQFHQTVALSSVFANEASPKGLT